MLSESNQPTYTPLQGIVGFQVSEQIYDELEIESEQLILDLLMCGWPQQAVADLMGMSQGTLSVKFKNIRLKLANTQLIRQLEAKEALKDTTERRSHRITQETNDDDRTEWGVGETNRE